MLLAYRDWQRLDTEPALRAVDWVCQAQNTDGGWGGDGQHSGVEETALAVEALAGIQPNRRHSAGARRWRNVVGRGGGGRSPSRGVANRFLLCQAVVLRKAVPVTVYAGRPGAGAALGGWVTRAQFEFTCPTCNSYRHIEDARIFRHSLRMQPKSFNGKPKETAEIVVGQASSLPNT